MLTFPRKLTCGCYIRARIEEERERQQQTRQRLLHERQLRNEERRRRRELQEERRRLKEECQKAREQVQRERDERNRVREQRIAEKEKKRNDELLHLLAEAKQAREADLQRMHAKKAAADEELAKAAGAVAQARQKLQELRATKDALVLQLKQVKPCWAHMPVLSSNPAHVSCPVSRHGRLQTKLTLMGRR
jgi:uncharacterized protein YwqG